jgi:polar amino acid transport system substrate-binding protein
MYLLPTLIVQTTQPTWADVQARGYLRVGVKDNLPSLAVRSGQGEWSGLEIDIAHQLAQELLGDRQAVRFVVLPQRDRLNSFDRVDVVIAQVTVTNNRRRLVDFSLPYYTDSTVLIARKGKTINQLQGILVLKNSATIAILQNSYPHLPTIGVDSYHAGVRALQSNPHLALAGDGVILHPWLKDNPDYSTVGAKLAFHSLAVVMPKGLASAELRQKVNQAVQKWRETGWLRERANFWQLP